MDFGMDKITTLYVIAAFFLSISTWINNGSFGYGMMTLGFMILAACAYHVMARIVNWINENG